MTPLDSSSEAASMYGRTLADIARGNCSLNMYYEAFLSTFVQAETFGRHNVWRLVASAFDIMHYTSMSSSLTP